VPRVTLISNNISYAFERPREKLQCVLLCAIMSPLCKMAEIDGFHREKLSSSRFFEKGRSDAGT
jgi:hypothetical protein